MGSKCGLPFELCLKLWLRTNPIFSVLFPLVHELVNPVNEGLHLFLRFVLRKTDAHRHMDVLTRRRGESLLLELRPDSFRCNGAIRACGHGQEDGEFFAAITISEIRLAQASFDHLAKSP